MRLKRAGLILSSLCVLLALAVTLRGVSAPLKLPPVQLDAAELFAYDRNLPLSAQEQFAEEADGYKAYRVTYLSANEQQVPAMLALPVRKEGERLPCILLMHGLGMDKTSLKFLWGPLTKAGYAVLAIDAQYHGDRKPKEAVELFGAYPYVTRDMLIQTIVDLRRGIDYLETRKEIDARRIGYLGFSMGGFLGAMLAAVDSRVQAPILALAGGNWSLLSGSSALPQAVRARTQKPDGIPEAARALDPVDPLHWVGRISPRPVLMINGDQDNIVPVACEKALHEAAQEPKEVMWYKGGHVPIGTEAKRVSDKVMRWLDDHLKKTER